MLLNCRVVIVFLLVAGCGCSGAQSKSTVATVEEPWGHASSLAPDGWWMSFSLAGKTPPYDVGTRFEIETLGPHGIRSTDVWEVREIRPRPAAGIFEVDLQSENTGTVSRGWHLPPEFLL